MKAYLFAGVAAAATLMLTPAIAQPQPGSAGPAGKDGMHSRAEVETRIASHFAKVDTNSDGVITKAEADAAHAAMRSSIGERRAERGEARADKRFDRIDTNDDGSISRQEFDAGHAGGAHMAGHGAGRGMAMGGIHGRMFEMADANKDGRVTLEEAQAAALRHFDMVDTNRDGQISREERQQMRQHMHGAKQPG